MNDATLSDCRELLAETLQQLSTRGVDLGPVYAILGLAQQLARNDAFSSGLTRLDRTQQKRATRALKQLQAGAEEALKLHDEMTTGEPQFEESLRAPYVALLEWIKSDRDVILATMRDNDSAPRSSAGRPVRSWYPNARLALKRVGVNAALTTTLFQAIGLLPLPRPPG